MSFILNALKKSEREREAAQAKLLSPHLIDSHRPHVKNNNSTWLMLLAAVNICCLAFVLWYFLKEEPREVEAKLLPDVTEFSQPILNVDVKKPKISVEKVKLAVVRQPVNKVSQESIAEQIQNKITPKQVPAAEVIRKNPIIEKKVEATVIFEKMNVNDVIVAEKMQDESKNILKIKPKPIKSQQNRLKVSPNTPPFLSELSYEERRSVPLFNMNVFVYSIEEAERFIMVDMVKYVVGQDIKENMLLKEIREESVVIEYKDKVFQVSR